jgi:hypothetical protein
MEVLLLALAARPFLARARPNYFCPPPGLPAGAAFVTSA